MNKLIALCVPSALLLSCGLAFGQAPYADTGCIVKSATPGRLVLLQVVEKPNAELKKDMAAFRTTLSGAVLAKLP